MNTWTFDLNFYKKLFRKPNTDNKGHLFVTVFELTAFL